MAFADVARDRSSTLTEKGIIGGEVKISQSGISL